MFHDSGAGTGKRNLADNSEPNLPGPYQNKKQNGLFFDFSPGLPIFAVWQ